ncbi:MAG: class I SAM-dependent methyltransferase [Clostridiales bacterium]|nr:class I SAM-dependent methyltransferase [Clostridiales bacterium]
MNIEKINHVIESTKDIKLFENSKTQEDFWDNEHISKMMLMAHLNPNWDAASRKPETIEATCKWIISTLDLNHQQSMLDLGCGPGLYSTKFYESGLNITGIDYSKRSLAYAKEQAADKKYDIKYINMNYLEIDYQASFDVVVLIYCDFGVLSSEYRNILLKKIHKALKPGGHFVFDVWTTAYDELTAEYKNWIVHEKQGFWKPTPHLELILKKYYQADQVSLKQHIILEEESNINVYNLWEQCYTVDTITSLLNNNEFEVKSIVGDLTGKSYDENSNLMGIVAKKK